MLKVLSTKLLSESLIDSAHQMDIVLTCVDAILVNRVDFDLSDLSSLTYDALIFTSSNAVSNFFRNENPVELKHVYATSGKTKDELLKQGISLTAAADNAEQLAELIIGEGNVGSALHICGNLTLDTMKDKLTDAGIGYTQFQVYETVLNNIEINEPFDAVMFYSPSGIESFVAKNKVSSGTLYCCIGATTAEKLKSINNNVEIILPKQPSPEAMLTAIKNLKKEKRDE